MMKKLHFKLVLAFLLSVSICSAQSSRDTLNVLFVGNSYTYFSNVPHLVSIISDSTSTKLLTSKSIVGGATLSQHWNGLRGLRTKELIKDGDFDIVVLQDHSMGTINQPDSFMFYANKFCDFIKQQEALPVFYETWAREKVPQFQETITEMYSRAASENDAQLARVGTAWKLAREIRPTIELFRPDGSHQSPLGAFLTACVFVQALTGQVPDQAPRRFIVTDAAGESILLQIVDPLDVEFCLRIVKQISN